MLITFVRSSDIDEAALGAKGLLRRRLGPDCHVDYPGKFTVTFSPALSEQAHK